MGTNDYNHAVPLGQWFDEQMESVEYGHEYVKRMENRLRRRPAMDTQTYRGRINIAIDSLKRAFPAKQIVLLTPIHRAGFYAGDKKLAVHGGISEPLRALSRQLCRCNKRGRKHLGRTSDRPQCTMRSISYVRRARTILQPSRYRPSASQRPRTRTHGAYTDVSVADTAMQFLIHQTIH